MRIEALIAVLILLCDCTGSARADLRALPQFSAAETQTIARNELLAAVIATDPWLVRRMLDIVARARAQGDWDRATMTPSAADPDLAISPRDLKGRDDWNELIKRAREEKDKREKPEPTASSRSSEGTIELIDLMRRAKARKDGAGVQ